ncbi:MAG: cobyric acid synthase [Candidatus Dadabacteria bacterium]|nr:MAG: cobyric acid synthase [Candidatus Dadabacteria bacterium]
MAKVLMLQGTGSDVGKSVLVAGLCRLLRQEGVRVAPFKPQNMALNSYITAEGGEMGRAQVVQAEAAGVEPHTDMNPVLLKPTTDVGAQVILQGKVYGNMKAREYHAFKPRAREVALESFRRLARRFEVILVEGAGSPAEINLREGDLANMGFALEVGAPVVLVGDIDKGGVFASLVGTLELLAPEERDLIRGFLVNKFRGDPSLLEPAFREITARTGRPFLGVVPYFRDIFIQEEDGIHREVVAARGGDGGVRIAVVVPNRISNFTDFDPFLAEPGVRLEFVWPGERLGRADAVILPGSKNTVDDLHALWRSGLADEILENRKRGAYVVGICGGYQMLGRWVRDPLGVESANREARGLGLLDVETEMEPEKITAQSEGRLRPGALAWAPEGDPLQGYEIHMGRTRLGPEARPLLDLRRRGGDPWHPDGAVSPDGRVFGTYLHGLFDNDGFRRAFLSLFREGAADSPSFARQKEEGYDRLADLLRRSLDLPAFWRILEGSPDV